MGRYSDEQREHFRRQAKRWWDNLSDDERAALREKRNAAYAQHFPDWLAVHQRVKGALADGRLVPQPCDRCGGEGRPVYNYDPQGPDVMGWRCYKCREQVRGLHPGTP